MKDYLYLSIIFCSFLASFAKTSTKTNPTNIQSPSPSISANNIPDFHEFNWKLCKALHDVEKNNAVISSLSVKLVLMMLYEGALGNTAKQIEEIVGFSGQKQSIRDRYLQKLQSLQSHDKDDYELDIGTKLLMDKTITPNNEFLKAIGKWYNASFEVVNFRKPENAINSVNQWAKDITHGHIQQIITEDETKENTVLLLLNAIYFKGHWTIPFNKEFTKNGIFHLNSKTSVDVPLMTNYEHFQISTLKSHNARIISLPYAGNKFVMYIILPESKDGLDDLINHISLSVLGESLQNMRWNYTKVVLPKFNFEYTSILGPILQKLGITDMFGTNANLTNIGKDPMGNLVVTNILQKSGIEVNEEGSTAHAITEAVVDHRLGPGTPEVIFEVNRPFLFLIQDKLMNTIVFVGQVKNPLSEGSPVVPVPVVNTTTQLKSVPENVNTRFNQDQSIDFQRFTYFDAELFQELGLNQPDSNFAASPASIKSILSLLSEGAQGDTLNQLNTVLRLPDDKSILHDVLHRNQLSMKSNLTDLVVVNNIFVKNKNSLSKNFVVIANDLYSANISEIDFLNIETSVRKINEHISSDTNGLINSIISKDDFDKSTELLLANVLYFKGDWLFEFNESNTKNQCFYTKPGVCNHVSMMNFEHKIRYAYISNIKAQAIELLYKDTDLAMVILLPDEDRQCIQTLKDLKHNPLSSVTNLMRQRHVNLYLPRFTMDYSTKLTTILKKMGITSIFDWNKNLSSIFDPAKDVAVKDVTHKVAIEVNEKGSKASGVTVVAVMTLSNIPELSTVTVNVNRPFMFFIINRATKNTLFSGQVHYINPATSTRGSFMDMTQTNYDVPIQYPSKYQQPQPKDKAGVNYKIM